MLLDLLAEYVDNEPPQADENMPLDQQNEVASVHDNWHRHVRGLYLLLGVRLVNDALDKRKETPDG